MLVNKRVLFLGSKQLGLRALQASIQAIPEHVFHAVTLDDTADKRSVLPEFKAFCEGVRLPLTVLTKPGEFSDIVCQCSPHIVFVIGWYWIINRQLLNILPGGFVGVHASLLPKYRGHSPLVWAILRGEQQSGVSMFYFEEGIDTGDIVDQVTFDIAPNDTIADALVKVESATLDLIGKYARPLVAGTAPTRKQNHELASYVSLRREEDGIINWHQTAMEVHNFVRAQTRPYPGAFTHLPDSRRLRIWRAGLFPHPFYGVPGLVGQKHGNGRVVSCGEGALVVYECGVDNEEPTPLSSVLKWGMRLG